MPAIERHPEIRTRKARPCIVAGILALLVLAAQPAIAVAEILILLSSDAAPYIQARDAILTDLKPRGLDVRAVDLAAAPGLDIKARPPSAAIAIGTEAAVWLHQNVPEPTPIHYCMVADPQGAGLTAGRPVTGITTQVPISAQVSLIAEALPRARTIGMLYRNEGPSRQAMDEMRRALPAGWKLEAVAVDEAPSTAQAIERLLESDVDMIWTTPDAGIYDAATVRALLLAALRSNTPVFGFSSQFVRAGALIGIGIQPADQGAQAAELVARGQPGPPRHEILAPNHHIAINQTVAANLGIKLPRDLVSRATDVYGK